MSSCNNQLQKLIQNFSYECSENGKRFKNSTGSFRQYTPVRCQDDELWSKSTITDPCECKKIQHALKMLI